MKLVCAVCASILLVVLLNSAPVAAQDVPKDYQEVLTYLGQNHD